MGTINSSLKGAILEKRAALWLLEEGYMVFENVTPVGAADLVAIKGDEVMLIDVKTGLGRPHYLHFPKRSHTQRALGVVYLTLLNEEWVFVDPEGTEAPIIEETTTIEIEEEE